jgi:group I intron endonuclease
MYTIYKAINKLDNNKAYVGYTSDWPVRKYKHEWHSKNDKPEQYFHRAIKKYGIESLKWEVIFETSSLDECLKMENILIAEHNTMRPNGYNIAEGGGKSPTLGKTLSEETKKKIGNANKGRKWTEERKKKKSLEYSGKGNPFYGKTFAPDKHPWIGRKHSDETRRKMSESKKRKHFVNPMSNSESRSKLSSTAKSRYKIVREDGTWYWGHKT